MGLPDSLKLKHFLVCDDHALTRSLIKGSLKSLGITKISEANSGNEGFQVIVEQMLEKSPIDFVITDLMMDNGSGINLVKQIRAYPATMAIPILMVTSKADVSIVLDSIKAGVNGYIVKPWIDEDLKKRILEIDKKIK